MQLVIETRQGAVRGVERDGVRVWRGIPFAAAPVGSLRFRPPQPPPRWDGERECGHAGPVSIQSSESIMSGMGPNTQMSEDCLRLQVFAPASDATKRAVVVWIHGGAFIMGSGSTPLYNGASFAQRHDLIVVTLNYRLGLLGFLYLGDLGGEPAGNVGLLDQVAALRWVQDNIAAFGGDPDNVTVMGESAGAMSIAHLLVMPAARGLFARAILESGAAALEPPTRADATTSATSVLATLGCSTAELEKLPVASLLAAQTKLSAERGLAAVSPFVDGVTVPEPPIAAIRAGESMQVPLLLGSNRDEWALFDTILPETTKVLMAQLEGRLGPVLAPLRAAYPDQTHLLSDLVFRIPMIRLAETNPAPVHMYRFDVASPAFGGRLGAAHALELAFVWNQLGQQMALLLLGGDTSPFAPTALKIHDTWAAFIKTGDPNNAGLPSWPRYDTTRRATLVIDHESHVEDDPDGAVRAMWTL